MNEYLFAVEAPTLAQKIAVLSMAILNGWSYDNSKNVVQIAEDFHLAGYECIIFAKNHRITASTTYRTNYGKKYSFEIIFDVLHGKYPEKELKLNNEHTAIVNKDGVSVGCQKFELKKIIELGEICKELLKQD